MELRERFGHEPRIHTEGAVEDALRWITGDVPSLDRPFYLALGLMEVHSSQWQIGETKADARAPHYGAEPAEDVLLPDFVPDLPGVRKPPARFYGCIRFMDRRLGRLFDAMRLLGRMRDTILVFTTDHGIAANRAKT